MKILKFIGILIVAQLVFAGFLDLDRTDFLIVIVFLAIGFLGLFTIDRRFPEKTNQDPNTIS